MLRHSRVFSFRQGLEFCRAEWYNGNGGAGRAFLILCADICFRESLSLHYLAHYDSPLGRITVASDGAALVGLWFEGQKYFGQGLSQSCEKEPLPGLEEAIRWLNIYFSGRVPDFTPPVCLDGLSPFRKRVLQILSEIPYGRVSTYGRIAERIRAETGKNVSAQAVGGAVGHNPVSLIIPCHRVVGADGSLTGYAGGVAKKAELLKMEGADLSKLYIPKRGTAL